MKFSGILGFVVSLLIVVILGTALLFTNVWYLILFSGVVASLIIRKGYLISTLSGFLGGVIVILLIFLTLPTGHIGALMGEVGSIAGIPSDLLIALIFLINGGLCLSGALLGTFVADAFHKG